MKAPKLQAGVLQGFILLESILDGQFSDDMFLSPVHIFVYLSTHRLMDGRRMNVSQRPILLDFD